MSGDKSPNKIYKKYILTWIIFPDSEVILMTKKRSMAIKTS